MFYVLHPFVPYLLTLPRSYILLLYRRYNLHGFVTVHCSGVGLIPPRLTPNLEDSGQPFLWPLLSDLSSMSGPTVSLRSRQHSKPLHDKAVVLEADRANCTM
jgi:hypothetical protein